MARTEQKLSSFAITLAAIAFMPSSAFGSDYFSPEALYARGDFQAAEQKLLPLVDVNEGSDNWLKYNELLGDIYLQTGKPGTAAKRLLSAYLKAPNGPRAPRILNLMAATMLELGEARKACTALTEAVKKSSLDPAEGRNAQSWIKKLNCAAADVDLKKSYDEIKSINSKQALPSILGALMNEDYVSANGKVRLYRRFNGEILLLNPHDSYVLQIGEAGSCKLLRASDFAKTCSFSDRVATVSGEVSYTYFLNASGHLIMNVTENSRPPIKYVFRKASSTNVYELAADQQQLEGANFTDTSYDNEAVLAEADARGARRNLPDQSARYQGSAEDEAILAEARARRARGYSDSPNTGQILGAFLTGITQGLTNNRVATSSTSGVQTSAAGTSDGSRKGSGAPNCELRYGPSCHWYLDNGAELDLNKNVVVPPRY